MTRRILDAEVQLARLTGSSEKDRVRDLLDRLSAQDLIISSLAPKQWLSIASRVPPGHREERAALAAIARLAEGLREEA